MISTLGKISVYQCGGRLATMLCFILIVTTIVTAQGTRGTIRGTVTDSNGAVVTGATVKLIDATRNLELRTAQTNNSGEYQFLELEPSTYSVVITAIGFAETRLSDAKVEPNRSLQLDAALNVGGTNVDITVTGELSSKVVYERMKEVAYS